MASQNIRRVITGWAVLSVGILAIAGCDKPVANSMPQAKPKVAVTDINFPDNAAAELSVHTTLPPSVITVDSHEVTFPGAKLAVISHEIGGITLRLCSDDPPAAIDPGYRGNSYLFDMQVPIDRVSELPAAHWDRKASDASDSTSGIFIHGYHEPLQPADLHVTFAKDGSELLTFINGTFLRDDNQNPGTPPKQLQVSACLHTNMPAD